MISVVIPAYNCEDSILQCIDSVLNQTKRDLISKIIVVDDGSTDNTKKVITDRFKSEDKVKVYSKKNGGVSSARNYGIRLANTEWIALLDSDDVWKNDKIEKQVNKLVNHKQISFIGTGRNNEKVRIGKKIEDGLYEMSILNMLFKSWPHTSTALIKKALIEEAGFYDENRTHAEDGQLWLKILNKHAIYYLSESLEVAGNNKKTFGEKGLSANLQAMHKGNILNIMECYKRGQISLVWKYFFVCYEELKYFRRKVLTK